MKKQEYIEKFGLEAWEKRLEYKRKYNWAHRDKLNKRRRYLYKHDPEIRRKSIEASVNYRRTHRDEYLEYSRKSNRTGKRTLQKKLKELYYQLIEIKARKDIIRENKWTPEYRKAYAAQYRREHKKNKNS